MIERLPQLSDLGVRLIDSHALGQVRIAHRKVESRNALRGFPNPLERAEGDVNALAPSEDHNHNDSEYEEPEKRSDPPNYAVNRTSGQTHHDGRAF